MHAGIGIGTGIKVHVYVSVVYALVGCWTNIAAMVQHTYHRELLYLVSCLCWSSEYWYSSTGTCNILTFSRLDRVRKQFLTNFASRPSGGAWGELSHWDPIPCDCSGRITLKFEGNQKRDENRVQVPTAHESPCLLTYGGTDCWHLFVLTECPRSWASHR